jgi:cytohesin
LHEALKSVHEDLIHFLVKHGADTTAQDNDRSTPLHLASMSYHGFLALTPEQLDAMRFLVEHGADPMTRDKDGSTPLLNASKFGSVDAARFFIDHGADVMARDDWGSTPLHLAAKSGYVDIVRFLVEHGADTTAQDKKGSTPLQVASRSLLGANDVARFLMEYDGSISTVCSSTAISAKSKECIAGEGARGGTNDECVTM